MEWLMNAKFGMFIHWGLYSQLAGEYNGKTVNGIAEWIMCRLEISKDDYATIAKEFNPQKFSAKFWVALAKAAGMKYIVITSKHHDGFAMYHSKSSAYNIVDATPYGKDPIAELAEECKKEGLKLCFYYSHAQDWDEENAVGNTWDFQRDVPFDPVLFDQYLDQKALPQITELLQNYGDIGIMWFDTPFYITKAHSQRVFDCVKSVQPNCIVSTRVGNDLGEYGGYGDNQCPIDATECFEMCGTLNDTWGFKKADHNWKDSETVLKILIDVVSKGGVYLLNIGPTGEGEIPPETIRILGEVGSWMQKNGDTIYNTEKSPFQYEFTWGAFTKKGDELFVHLFEDCSEFAVHGIQNKVLAATMDGQPLSFVQSTEKDLNLCKLVIDLPQKNNALSVIRLKLDGEPLVDNRLTQMANGDIELPVFRAEVHLGASNTQALDAFNHDTDLANLQTFGIAKDNVVENWKHVEDYLSWDVLVVKPGTYAIEVLSQVDDPCSWLGETEGNWEGNHEVYIEVNDQQVHFEITRGMVETNSRSLYFKKMRSPTQQVFSFEKAGHYTVALKATKLNFDKLGFKAECLIFKPLAQKY